MPYDVVVERDLLTPMRDGARLYADVYRPARGPGPVDDRFPAILVRTTYDKNRPQEVNDAQRFARQGYVYVVQDVRGRYASDGTYYHGIYETDDGYDTVEWIAGQPWSNGKVGMTGISYLGAVQCAVAIAGAPHLASIFHVKAPSDYYQNGFRHHGTFLMYMMPITLMFAQSSREALADPILLRGLQKAYESSAEWLTRMPLKEGMNPLTPVPDTERWLFDMLTHPDYDEFWKRVALWQPEEYVDQYADVPGCYVGGWYDLYHEETFYTTLAPKKKGPIHLVMGPWTHLGWDDYFGDVDYGPDATLSESQYFDLQRSWFDATLKGDPGQLREPPVKIFVMGGGDGAKSPAGKLRHGGQWRYEQEWPLARTAFTPYYLRGHHLLSPERPPADEAPSTYRYDPLDPVPTIGGSSYFVAGTDPTTGRRRLSVPYGGQDQRERVGSFGCKTNLPLSSRHDVLVFQTPPLERDVEVTGPIAARLWIASSAVDTDFTVKLIDVSPPNADYPDGYALNLADGIIRARYRDGYERGQLLTPGQVYGVTVELYATSNLFKAGHRIRIDVSSSNYPTYDPNPNTGDSFMQNGRCVAADNTVYHDASRPSRIGLPIVC